MFLELIKISIPEAFKRQFWKAFWIPIFSQEEKDQAVIDLNNVETAFADVHRQGYQTLYLRNDQIAKNP